MTTPAARRRALEAALEAAPDDTVTRLVLADLCEEEGEWEWAAVHRVSAARVTDANFSPPGPARMFHSARQVTSGGGRRLVQWTMIVHGQYEGEVYYSYCWGPGAHWERQRPAVFGDPWQRVRPSPSVRAVVEAAGFEALRRLSTPAH